MTSYKKRFLAASVNATGWTHDARLFHHTAVFNDALEGGILPDKTINLGDECAEIPLVTVGDGAFKRYHWIVFQAQQRIQNSILTKN